MDSDVEGIAAPLDAVPLRAEKIKVAQIEAVGFTAASLVTVSVPIVAETEAPLISTIIAIVPAPVTATTVTAVAVAATIATAIVAPEETELDIVLSDVVTKNSLPVLTDDICLFPGSEPIVRVEEAPSNARRIFTGVDIMADMESIWDVLTNFDRLQDVVPSLVKNEVLQTMVTPLQ